jgi:hypothetical protein
MEDIVDSGIPRAVRAADNTRQDDQREQAKGLPASLCAKNLSKKWLMVYSMLSASAGQTSTQVWQSTHMSLSTFALSLSMDIADAGHSFTHVSHPVHFSLSTIATNLFTPPIYLAKGKKRVSFGAEDFFKNCWHFSCLMSDFPQTLAIIFCGSGCHAEGRFFLMPSWIPTIRIWIPRPSGEGPGFFMRKKRILKRDFKETRGA